MFYLYRKSPKRLKELKMLSEMYNYSISKPYKLCGTRWIADIVKAMEIILYNHRVYIITEYIKHLESLAHTDSRH